MLYVNPRVKVFNFLSLRRTAYSLGQLMILYVLLFFVKRPQLFLTSSASDLYNNVQQQKICITRTINSKTIFSVFGAK